MQRAVDSALKFLVDAEMVLEIGEHLGATEFGALVSRLYIDPRSAAKIVSTHEERTDYAISASSSSSAARPICLVSMFGIQTGRSWSG